MLSRLKRGHTIEFIKRLKEPINERYLLLIESGSKGFVVDVFENEAHIKLIGRDMTVAIRKEELNGLVKISS